MSLVTVDLPQPRRKIPSWLPQALGYNPLHRLPGLGPSRLRLQQARKRFPDAGLGNGSRVSVAADLAVYVCQRVALDHPALAGSTAQFWRTVKPSISDSSLTKCCRSALASSSDATCWRIGMICAFRWPSPRP